MQEKYGPQGFNIVAISPEDSKDIPPFLKGERGKDINYFIGVEANVPKAYGIRGFPTIIMLDAEGKVLSVGHGLPTDEQLAAWLGGAGAGHVMIEHEVDEAVKPVVELYNKQEYAKAVEAAKKLADDESLSELAKIDAEHVIGLVDEMVEKAEKQIDKYKKDGDYAKLSKLLVDVQKRFKGLDIATKAKAEEEKVKNDPKVKAEMLAFKELEPLLAALSKAKNDSERGKAREALKKFIDKYKDSAAAKRAEKAME